MRFNACLSARNFKRRQAYGITKFRIFRTSKIESLHLNLRGGFDASPAGEPLRSIKKSFSGSLLVVIPTSHVDHIYSFGRNPFNKIVSELKAERIHLFFTGENANQLAAK